MSTNLGATQLSGGMANPETGVNSATGRLDAAITETLVVDLTNDYSLPTAAYQANFRFEITPAGVGKKLTLPAVKRFAFFENTTANDVILKRGTTELTLATLTSALFYSDGTANGLVQLDVTGIKPFDMGIYIPGKPGDNATSLRFNVIRKFKLPAGLTGSTISAGVASTGAAATFILKKGTTTIGTLVFNASASPTITFSADVTFDVGDVFTIIAPTPQDATLADIGINLKGTRV